MRIMWNPDPRQLAALKAALFVACLLPAGRLVYEFLTDKLAATPVEDLGRGLGFWAVSLLLLTLCVTPARRLSGAQWLMRFRRMLGLFAFFYAALHVSSYLWLDQRFDWQEIGGDIAKHPWMILGIASFVLLLPLAATSNKAMVRRLGGARWQSLHGLVHLIAPLAVVHYWGMAKPESSAPAFYALAVIWLLGMRALWRKVDRQKKLESAMSRPRSGKVIPIIAKKR